MSDQTIDTPRRTLEEIASTGAAWVTETELEWMVAELRHVEERLRPVIEEANQTLESLSGEVDWENAFIQLVEKIEAAAGSREPRNSDAS
jgi:predicted RNA-binding protein with EMAP domain